MLPEPKITLFSGLHFFPTAHIHQKLGWENTHKFITHPPPLLTGGNLVNHLGKLELLFKDFDTFYILTPFELTFLPQDWSFIFIFNIF